MEKRTNIKILFRGLILIIILLTLMPVSHTAYSADEVDSVEIINIEHEKINSDTVKIIWNTDQPSEGKVIFGLKENDLKYYIGDNSGKDKYHEVILSNLKEDTKYFYRVIVVNNTEEIQSFIHSFKTEEEKKGEGKPPVASDIKIAFISGTVVAITWETDKEANSIVEYDTLKTYKKRSTKSSRTTLHNIVLKNLKPNTEYFLRVSSVNKNKNSSGYSFLSLKTRINDNIDKEEFKIMNLRPSGPDDSAISTTHTAVSFKTNHWAKGSVVLSGKGIRTKKVNLDYNTNYYTSFSGLEPGSEYKIKIAMTNVFGKKKTEEFTIITKTITESQRLAIIEQAVGIQGSCLNFLMERDGFFAEYFNLPVSASNLLLSEVSSDPLSTGWFDIKYLTQSRIDEDINYGNKFFPLDQGLQEDPNYFSVYWGAFFEIDKTKKYSFKVTSDDDSWVYIDGTLAINNNGLRTRAKSKSIKPELTKGWHRIEIYFTQRQDKGSRFSFSTTKGIEFHPLPPSCSWLPGFEDFTGSSEADIVVAGIEYIPYTQSSALLKTSDSSKIWSILNNQRYNILSPSSFNDYGYRWGDVKTVGWAEINQYPRASLVKSPNSPAIYYIYERPGNMLYKIKIPTPAVFLSYLSNEWGRVVTVSEKDINSIPDIPLIKSVDNLAVYLLVNGKKQLVTQSEFINKGYSSDQVGVVSQVHLDNYK